MKRTVFTCFILAASFSTGMAQSASVNPVAPAEQKISPKLLLSSKINQFYAYALRNNAVQAEKAFNEAMAMMQGHLTENGKKMGNNSDVVKNEQSLYTEVKGLSGEIMTNKEVIQTKMRAFMQTL